MNTHITDTPPVKNPGETGRNTEGYVPRDPETLKRIHMDVICRLSLGYRQNEVAEQVGCSKTMVASYLKDIFRVWDVRNVAAAVRKGIELGFIPVEMKTPDNVSVDEGSVGMGVTQ